MTHDSKRVDAIPPSPLRPCRNTVHGSRASPRTVLHDRKFKYLPVHPELVEGLRVNCDTVSFGRGKGEGSDSLERCTVTSVLS
jgi:hypothetical protein